jgi:hypothetical protein
MLLTHEVTAMAFLGFFQTKKRTLNDLTADELNRERITIEQEQRRLDREAEQLDRDQKQLLSEYTAAGTPTQKRIVARKLQGVELRQKAADAKSSHCHKMLQTVSNFLILKDRMGFFNKFGVGRLLNNLDVAEVEQLVAQATVDGQLQEEKLATMLQQLDDANAQMLQGSDASLDDYMARLDEQVAATKEAVPAADADHLKDYMSGLDAQLQRGAQLAKGLQTNRQPAPEEG